jgi:hypothetical protein
MPSQEQTMVNPVKVMVQPNAPEQVAGPDEGEVGSPAQSTHDDALILWMLGLSPGDRLRVAQGFAESVLELRHGRKP